MANKPSAPPPKTHADLKILAASDEVAPDVWHAPMKPGTVQREYHSTPAEPLKNPGAIVAPNPNGGTDCHVTQDTPSARAQVDRFNDTMANLQKKYGLQVPGAVKIKPGACP